MQRKVCSAGITDTRFGERAGEVDEVPRLEISLNLRGDFQICVETSRRTPRHLLCACRLPDTSDHHSGFLCNESAVPLYQTELPVCHMAEE